ncbi:Secretion system apparatus protein SsaV [Ralstonia mannitolilytica]|uniref:Secretion system apparatus protein SsaV n=2 Tax=Ralstonia mannitolilytica TaxID=105219 RepID=A0AAJ4ZPL4_9RALS|nr:Protein MxiA [Ralstonia mannitolilytica]CAJ0735960.1 Protein MxiA [Ralstonia mannitolilytica]SUE24335.1 Secretion system apparatus protein SsaV [Ralstonia mannitolilytica]SUE25759.1 Secretion system apparatus protein SsaV [Ralstonia mannitolilytica]SUE35568.1 Secretion system apparatus protein SsaV [Ralstonia mannitolilytica]
MAKPRNLAAALDIPLTGMRWARLVNYDIAIAVFVVAVVALFVLPLPTVVLDGLISLNLAASIVLLCVSIYLPSALAFSSFPAVLLFTTLFRLSLNIASCKLILLQANAGHVIDTFGKLVVGNNFVVGGVVFLVIAVVQFIVIAKGSERVAEVGARFSLDAMPGKQMSIDADLRAGIITSDEAKRRREALEQESQLHGAMDGAMKFVKGDAIAGIIIAVINILAGIAVGALMHGMSIGDALHRYAILTVGDGMASQIPSLLVSIAAGIVTTRVATRDRDARHLGQQIGAQITAHPRGMLMASGVLLAFLLVPGFPKWSFLLLAVGTAGAAFLRMRQRRQAPPLDLLVLGTDTRQLDEPGTGSPMEGIAAPIAVRLAEDLRGEIDLVALQTRLAEAKSRVQRKLGAVFPRVQLNWDAALPARGYALLVQDVPAAEGTLPGRDAIPASALPGEARLAAEVETLIERNAASLIGIQETQNLIQIMRREHGELVAELTRLVPPQRITEVLRRLVQEGVSVRNLRAIFESLITWSPKEPEDVIGLVELVRVDLHRQITEQFCGTSRVLDVVLFEQSLQERIEQAVVHTKQGSVLSLTRDVKQAITDQVVKILGGTRPLEKDRNGRPLAVMVSLNCRRYVKTMLQPVFGDLPVLSYQEIDEAIELNTVGWVTNPA